MIESTSNEKYKHLKKLIEQKKYRDENDEFVVFGEHLIEEAKKHSKISAIYTTNNEKSGVLISKNLMKELSQTVTPFERLAVVKKVNKDIESDKVLVLEDVQDPNNVGALLRSAAAFGFKKVLVSSKTADIYNDKVIRASQGSIFHLDIKRCDIYKEILNLKNKGFNVVVADIDANSEIELFDKIVLILGNEGNGITETAKSLADSIVTIKTEIVESLNVSVAGSILMYEWSIKWKLLVILILMVKIL